MFSSVNGEERESLLGNVVLKNYSTNSKEPNDNNNFLRDEISDCIVILEHANKKAPFKDPDLKRSYYKYRLLFLVMATSGLIAIPGSLSYLLINLIKVPRQLKENLDQQKNINAKIDAISNDEKKLEKYYNELMHLASLKSSLDYNTCEHLFVNWHNSTILEFDIQYYVSHVSANINNCIEWWDDQLIRQKLGDIFPEIKLLKRQDYNLMEVVYNCWFVDNNKTHPLPECESVARSICLNTTDYQYNEALYWQLLSDLEKAEKPLDKQYFHYEDKLDQLKNSASALQESADAPFQSFSNLNLMMLGIFTFWFVAILYFSCRIFQPRKAYKADIKNQGDNIFRFFSSEGHHNKIAALSKRVNFELTPATEIKPLLDHLKQEKNKIEERSAKRMAFLAGMRLYNQEATNHEFLNKDLNRDMTKIIFKYAGLM